MSTTLVNVSTRPVELHLPAGVTVLQARQRLDCADEDAAAGQVAALVRRGVLIALPAADNAADNDNDNAADADADDDDDDSEGKTPARRTSRRTRRSSDKPAESS
jgi:hypothetical protein